MQEEAASIPAFRTQLPISKVKRICKLDPDSTLISSEAAQLITMATERFIGILAKAAYGQAALLKRRTIQAKDVENCIRTHGLFEFLEGTLDGWPDMDNARRKGKTQSSAEQKENLPNSQEFPSSEIVAEGKDSSAVEEETSEIDASSSSDVLIAENESNL